MARTAKRYQEATQKKKSSILVYTAAIYARLSVDNDKKKSESIDTQIALILEKPEQILLEMDLNK